MVSPTQPLPTAAQAIAWVASALALADVRSGTQTFSESTVKRIAACDPSVSDEKVSALLAGVVEGVFQPKYLAGRGLDDNTAAQHRGVVLAGLEGALAVWGRLASVVNAADDRQRPAVIQLMSVVALGDISARLAAYLALYGHVVPSWRRIGSWTRKPGIAEALSQLRERANHRASDAKLREGAGIEPHTFRDLRTGRHLPKENTLLGLARALAPLHVDDGLTAEEIVVELRLARLIACVREALSKSPELARAVAFEIRTFDFYVSDLRRYSPRDLAGIVAAGTQWSRWPEVHARLQHVLLGDVVSIAAAMKAEADQAETEFRLIAETDPRAALRSSADRCRLLAAQARESVSACPGWERTTAADLVAMWEGSAAVFSAVADGRPPPRASLDRDTLKAKCLCDQAVAPWSNLSRGQQHALFHQAVETDPACAYVRFQYGAFLAQDDSQADEAIRHLGVAVMLDDDYNEARGVLATALLGAGRHEEALQHVDVLERREGPSSTTTFVRGAALLGLGQAEAARDVFQARLRAARRDLVGHLGMAEALEALGDHRLARRHRRVFELLSGRRSPRA